MGNGLLVFIDKKVGMDKFFSKNEIVSYDSVNDLASKISYLKKNDKLTILKDKELLQWMQINSNNNNESIYNNTETKCEVNECNTLVNNKFSSDYSFIDSNSDNLLENFYSSINSNVAINTPNNDNNQNTRQNKSLDNDYEKLMKDRNNEFKSIERH